MDYSKLSDFEINVKVSLELFEGSSGGDVSRVATWCACKENGEYGLFDPCNNPADAWQIIVGNRIALYPRKDGGWIAQGFENCVAVIDDNPLRAAMIVFLMMQGE